MYSTVLVYKLLVEKRGVNRAGPNAGLAGSGRVEQFASNPGQIISPLMIRAGFNLRIN